MNERTNQYNKTNLGNTARVRHGAEERVGLHLGWRHATVVILVVRPVLVAVHRVTGAATLDLINPSYISDGDGDGDDNDDDDDGEEEEEMLLLLFLLLLMLFVLLLLLLLLLLLFLLRRRRRRRMATTKTTTPTQRLRRR